MVETRTSVDNTKLLDSMTEVVDLVIAGDGGLTALQRMVEVAAQASGSAGAVFIEFGVALGRVVAASGGLSRMLGRPIDTGRPSIATLLAGDRVRVFASEELGSEGRIELAAQGLPVMMRAVTRVGGVPIGALVVCYGPEEEPTPVQQAALALVASSVAHLYTLGRGLPVHHDARAVADPGEAFAVLDGASVVRSWNAAAARLTARSQIDAIGQPWPFPLPAAAEVVEHKMACGNWIEIRAGSIPGSRDRAVSFRPRPVRSGRDEDRDLFVALTSHELRTPVTVIRGYADTLTEHWHSLGEGDRREAVDIIGQRARDLSRLVDRLMMAAGSATGSATGSVAGSAGGPLSSVPLAAFDLVETLRGAALELPPDLRRHLHVDLPVELPRAIGDQPSMVTVVTELVTNACKYSRGRVEVELTAGVDPHNVWLRVADRGVGVRPEHVEQVFERFWQMETGDQRRYGGVGLGLYLVRKIVERQHGWVSLRPRDGGGTVAEVRLRRADSDSERG